MIREFSKKDFDALSAKAKTEKRLRTHLNAHPTLDSNVQRLFIATEPGTYMRPHRHTEAHKWEFFTVLRGRIDLIVFSDSGNPIKRIALSPDGTLSTEVPPNTWHCYLCMHPGTLALEVKEGAYIPTGEDDFAPWAPAEFSDGVAEYMDNLGSYSPTDAK